MTMKYPPEEWAIRCEDQFNAPADATVSMVLTGQVRVQVDNSARINGCFKILLGGGDTLKIDIPAERALIMGGAASYRLKMEVRPGDIELRVNSTTSEWFDLEDR